MVKFWTGARHSLFFHCFMQFVAKFGIKGSPPPLRLASLRKILDPPLGKLSNGSVNSAYSVNFVYL